MLRVWPNSLKDSLAVVLGPVLMSSIALNLKFYLSLPSRY